MPSRALHCLGISNPAHWIGKKQKFKIKPVKKNIEIFNKIPFFDAPRGGQFLTRPI